MDKAEAEFELETSDPELDFNIEEYPSQEELNRIPESPPLFTQADDMVIEDIATQTQPPKATDSSSKSRKGSDVIIDIEDDIADNNDVSKAEEDDPGSVFEEKRSCSQEFPEEDDEFLISVAENMEESGVEEPTGGKGMEEETSSAVPENVQEEELLAFCPPASLADMDPDTMAKERKRKEVVEGFRKFQPMEKVFPDVRCSEYNTVAFKINPNYQPMDPLEPNPPKCMTKWDPKFVPMPFSDENVIIIKPKANQNQPDEGNDNTTDASNAAGSSTGHSVAFKKIRVWNRITELLSNFSLSSAEDIGLALKRYCVRMTGEVKALKYCTEELMTSAGKDNFFFKVIPFMTSLVIQTPEIVTCPLPFLRRNVNHNISLSQKQVACLLANAFFCTFPRRFKSEMDMPSINFKELFVEEDEGIMKIKAEKIRCLIHYFTRIEAEMPQGVVTYTRKNLRHSNMPDWGKVDKSLTKLVPLLDGTIEEDGAGMLKVDFANCFIGGGALGRGAVQEEILFVIYPELILTRLFCEKLNSNEAVIITGCERFSSYLGYASSFKFDGDYIDTNPYDSKGRRCNQIVAIDALYISRPSFQYHPRHVTRELNKAYVGFTSPVNQPVAVATGKWGCGAFNGDPQLKTIIQLLAASNAGRDVALYTFGDLNCLNDILSIYDSIHNMKIKDVWNLLSQYHTICCSTSKPTRSLKDFCSQYSAGQQWQIQQEQQKQKQSASTSKKTKEVPLTNFYSYEKRPAPPSSSLDDANVTALINGIDKINSQEKSFGESKGVVVAAGKRQREHEDEPSGLTEEEIQQQLLMDEASQGLPPCEKPKDKEQNGLKGGNPSGKFEASPKTPKRAKTLLDFYQKPS